MALWRALTLAHAMYDCRASVVVTNLPDPRDGCIRVTGSVFTTFAAHRCGDCMFSGHAGIMTTLLLFWASHPVPPGGAAWTARAVTVVAMRAFSAACMALGFWAILANRTHYAVDVLISAYVSCGIWWSHAHFWARWRSTAPYCMAAVAPSAVPLMACKDEGGACSP